MAHGLQMEGFECYDGACVAFPFFTAPAAGPDRAPALLQGWRIRSPSSGWRARGPAGTCRTPLPYKETPEPIRGHCRLHRMSRGSACRLLEVWAVASDEALLPLRHFVSAVCSVYATLLRCPLPLCFSPPAPLRPHTCRAVRRLTRRRRVALLDGFLGWVAQSGSQVTAETCCRIAHIPGAAVQLSHISTSTEARAPSVSQEYQFVMKTLLQIPNLYIWFKYNKHIFVYIWPVL